MSYRDHPIDDYQSLLTDGAVLVDVREPDEVAAGTLPGSINVPMSELQDRIGELPTDATLLVFCRSGGRSANVGQALSQAGYDVVNLTGGMLVFGVG